MGGAETQLKALRGKAHWKCEDPSCSVGMKPRIVPQPARAPRSAAPHSSRGRLLLALSSLELQLAEPLAPLALFVVE